MAVSVACNKDGNLSILDDNDPIFQYIVDHGTVPNRKLFRRWAMAQMFYMMAAEEYKTHYPVGVTGMIHRLGYEYTWKMLLNELHAQVKMAKHNDRENFEDRHRWFNQAVVMQMAKHYISELQKKLHETKPGNPVIFTFTHGGSWYNKVTERIPISYQFIQEIVNQLI